MVDLGRLRGGGFVVIGRAGMDLYADPPGTALEDAGRFDAALGGSAGNIAVGLVKLECEAALVSCLSDDAVGRWCLAQLRPGASIAAICASWAARRALRWPWWTPMATRPKE